MADRMDSPAELDREIALRRERLERDLHELQARLSPGQLLDEGMAYLRRSQGADFFRNLGESVRDRPLPVALVGIGLTWLAASGAGPNGRARVAEPDEPGAATRAWEAGRSVVRSAGETEADYRDRVLRARAQVMGVAQQAGEAADAYRERVEEAMYAARDSARNMRDKMASAASDGYARAQDYAGRAGDTASRAAGSVGRTGSDVAHAVGDNPILLGALGMVAGALLGAVIPRSRTEDEMLGPVAEGAVGTARSAVRQVADEGERVARAAMDAGVDAAQGTDDGDARRRAGDGNARPHDGDGDPRRHSDDGREMPAANRASDIDRPPVPPADLARRGPDRPAAAGATGTPDVRTAGRGDGAEGGITPLPGTTRSNGAGTSPMIG